jgi:pyridoxamine 5'-phosphate oxidase
MASRRMTDIADLRRQYGRAQLKRNELDPSPFVQFKKWMDEAVSMDLVDANAMSVATVGTAGEPSIRTVLLKSFDERGFVFYTNLESTKAKQISENPNVALLFYWREFERQVKIRGRATKLTAADVAKYFLSRPRDSQLAAWSSPQSRIIDARMMLEQKFDEMKRKFAEGEVPVPSFWGGFCVAPRTIEFWQGGTHRLHDRFQYTDDVAGWRIDQLAP